MFRGLGFRGFSGFKELLQFMTKPLVFGESEYPLLNIVLPVVL